MGRAVIIITCADWTTLSITGCVLRAPWLPPPNSWALRRPLLICSTRYDFSRDQPCPMQRYFLCSRYSKDVSRRRGTASAKGFPPWLLSSVLAWDNGVEVLRQVAIGTSKCSAYFYFCFWMWVFWVSCHQKRRSIELDMTRRRLKK